MEALGCDLLMVCSNVSPDSLGGIDRAAADLRELGDRAARRGMRVAFEALAWGRHINDYRDAWEAVRRADSSGGRPGARYLPHPGARHGPLRHPRHPARPHLPRSRRPTRPKLDMDNLSWSRHFHYFPGQGDFLDAFMDALAATGFDGLFSLEIFNDQFRSGSTRKVADRWPSLADLPFDRLHARPARRRPDADAAAGQCLGVEFTRVHLLDDQAAVRLSRACCRGWASAAPASTSPSRSRDGARATSASWSTPRRKVSPTPATSPHGTAVCALRPARRRCRRQRSTGSAPARHAVPPGRRAGRAGDPRGARPRRQPDLFHRSQRPTWARVGHRSSVRSRDGSDKGDAGLLAGRSTSNR